MGEVFSGRYELIDPLGEGGVGVVWRAWDRRAERYVAAKVLRQVDAASLLRFVREQSVRIHHDHVLMPLGWSGDDDRVVLVMPLIAGGSVATLVGDHGPLPPAWVATLLDQLLDGLSAIHAAGWVHRDVKPANLLLEPTSRRRPHLRLSDFGIAAGIGDPRLTHTGVVVGTPGFVAPEAAGGADPEPRHDLYAAGMSAVEMLTGSRPAPHGEPEWALAMLDPAVPLEAFVKSLIAVRAEDRPSSAVEARQLLAATGAVVVDADMPAGHDLEIEVIDQLVTLPDGWSDSAQDSGGDQLADAGRATSVVDHPEDAEPPDSRPRWRLLLGVALAVAGSLLLVLAVALDV